MGFSGTHQVLATVIPIVIPISQRKPNGLSTEQTYGLKESFTTSTRIKVCRSYQQSTTQHLCCIHQFLPAQQTFPLQNSLALLQHQRHPKIQVCIPLLADLGFTSLQKSFHCAQNSTRKGAGWNTKTRNLGFSQ